VQHCTPEQLALAALREPLPAEDTAHLASCERCRAEVGSLQRSVDAVAVPQLAAPGAAVPPPPRVWEAVAAATGVSAAPGADVVSASVPPAAPGPPGPGNTVPPRSGAEVLAFRPRRPRLLLVAAAAVAGAVIGAGAVAVLRGGDDGNAVSTVELDPLADSAASGRAAVVQHDDGSRVLEVDLRAPALDQGYYEVWLLETSVEGMVQVGVVRPGMTDLPLPDGLDLGEFPLVDVSVEPLDGNPAHSGVSVARGELDS
jgi:hypothetical protein